MPRPRLARIPTTLRVGVRAANRARLSPDHTERGRPRRRRDVEGVETTVMAQWRVFSKTRENSRRTGNEPGSSGYFVLTRADVDAVEASTGYTMGPGDVVTSRGGVPLPDRLYVVERRPFAHTGTPWSGLGKAECWRFDVSDRAPD